MSAPSTPNAIARSVPTSLEEEALRETLMVGGELGGELGAVAFSQGKNS